MKKIIVLAVALAAGVMAFAQGRSEKVPVAVYYPETVDGVSAEAAAVLMNKLNTATANNGMGAINETPQFYITCVPVENEKYVVAGAPTKYFFKSDLNFYVVDAFAKKIFSSFTLPSQGIGNSETKAMIQCFKQFSPTNAKFLKYLNDTDAQIKAYYEGRVDLIIKKANTLASAYKYEEALFELAVVPEACDCYEKVLDAANVIWQKYIDDKAAKALAKARSIWAAGQDALAAAEAGEYLAEIMPDSKYYGAARELSDEMKARVKSDIDYYRKLEERDNAQNFHLANQTINAWREVGVAYGNNQQPVTYRDAWPLR